MKSVGNGEFWRLYYLLPEQVRAQSRQAYRLFMTNWIERDG